MQPTISIILPCYRAERFIADIVTDVIAQTYPCWELIVVSNGAGQGAQLAILDGFQETIGEDKLIVLSEEEGNVSHARNVGMQHARGEWLTFVDADDRITPEHLQLLIGATQTDEPDLIIAGYTEINPKRGRTRALKPCDTEGNISKRDIVKQFHMVSTVWNLLFRSSFVKRNKLRFNAEFKVYEDGIFIAQCLFATDRVKALPLSGYRHIFVNEESAVNRYHAEWAEAERTLSDLHLQLRQVAGYSDDEINEERIHAHYMAKQHALHNMLMLGSPFTTFRELVSEAKRIVFDDPEMPTLMQRKYRSRHAKWDRLIGFDVAYDLRSPRYMVFALKYLIPLVETYRIRIKEQLLGRE